MKNKAVSKGKINYLSASQISTFDTQQIGGCNRKWYFEKVLGFETEATSQQKAGTKIHSQIEHYLKTGEKVFDKAVLPGVKFLPTPFTVEVEKPVKGFELAEVPIAGFIDVLNYSEQWIDSDGAAQYQRSDEIEILDWKTTSDIKYAKTGNELYHTVQMPLYGLFASELFPRADHIRLSHVYFQTKKAPASKKSTAIFSLDEIYQRANSIRATINEMKETAQAQGIELVEPNFNACMSYNRTCPFIEHCPKTTRQTIDVLFGDLKSGDNTMGLDRFTNRLKNNTTPLPQVVAPKVEAPLPKITLPTEQEILETAKAQIAEETKRGLIAFGITPPDEKRVEETKQFEPEPIGKERTKGFTQPVKAAEPQQAVFSETRRSDSQPMREAIDSNQARLAKMYQDNTKPEETKVEAAKHFVATLANIGALPLPIDENLLPKTTPEKQQMGLEIFVNVLVRGLELKDLQTEINRALREIETKYSVPDIRLGKEPLAFGGWKAVLASVLKSYNLQGRYFLHSTSEIAQVAIDALESQATLIVRGL